MIDRQPPFNLRRVALAFLMALMFGGVGFFFNSSMGIAMVGAFGAGFFLVSGRWGRVWLVIRGALGFALMLLALVPAGIRRTSEAPPGTGPAALEREAARLEAAKAEYASNVARSSQEAVVAFRKDPGRFTAEVALAEARIAAKDWNPAQSAVNGARSSLRPLLTSEIAKDPQLTALTARLDAAEHKMNTTLNNEAQRSVRIGQVIGFAEMGQLNELKAALGQDRSLANEHNPNGLPILRVAAQTDCVECAAALIDAGAKLEAGEPQFGQTALHGAAGSSTLEMVKLLVSRGAAINARARNGFTPLAMARDNFFQDSYGERKKIVSFLLARGAKE